MVAFFEKLRAAVFNKRGESLVEVMVSIVVSGLAILMLATTVAAASHIVLDNRTAMERYYDESNKIVQSDSTVTQTGQVKLVVDGSDEVVRLEEGDSDSVKVSYDVAPNVGGKVMATYEKESS